jgi:uncharacterized membrane protein YedE/YeeE
MSWQPVIDRLGEPGTLAAAGLVIGIAFGFLAQRSRFCLRSAVIEFSRNLVGGKLTVWLFGVGMILARGCSSRLLVLAAQGNLRSVVSGLTIAAAWWATYAIGHSSFDPHPVQALSFTGPSGAAVFSITSWVTLSAIWVAAALTDRLVDQRPQAGGSTLDQPMPGAAAHA